MNDVAVPYSIDALAASPSLNLYIESLGNMNEFCMPSVLILWPNQLMIIPALRWQLFLSKNLEGEINVHLHELHLMRANHMSMGDKTCFIRWPNLPPLEQNVWEVKYSMFIPVRYLSSPAPRVVIELNKY